MCRRGHAEPGWYTPVGGAPRLAPERPKSSGVLTFGMRTYTTPMMAIMFVAMIIIAWLADITWWMIAIGAVLALVGYFLERRREEE